MKPMEHIVKERYAKGALQKESTLCCPTSYNKKFLEVIPQEILDKDYGCGDPSRYLREGDVVLDLGSGTGKLCYIASQIVGPSGQVIGVDFNPPMLELARRYQKEIGDRIGHHNVSFRRGRIQDLQLDLDLLETFLSKNPLRTAEAFLEFEAYRTNISKERPLIPNESIDVIVSNCVLNLVQQEEKTQLFQEMHRVLKRGGRVAISDIVSDEDVPKTLQEDPELWSGCVSGAFREDLFLKAFEDAGFYGIHIETLEQEVFRTVQGIEFRSITMTAYKGKEGPCLEGNQAVIYKGPWKQVEDDDAHVYRRGERTAVCDKTYHIFTKPPYREEMILVPPRKKVSLKHAKAFDCARPTLRHPRETKGKSYRKTSTSSGTSVCGPESGCC